MTTLLLASASPARLAILRSAGVQPLVLVSDVDEAAVAARYGVADAVDIVLVLARAKAEDVAARWDDEVDDAPDEGVLVLGCDSLLEFDGQALGKPADAAEAAARWRSMRGRSGVLHTGHWLVDARETDEGGAGGGTGATLGAVASTTVHFGDPTDDEIDAYVATGEPLEVAGAFTVDGLGGAFIRGVEGDPHAVIGLSLPLLRELLVEVGVRWTDLWGTTAAQPRH